MFIFWKKMEKKHMYYIIFNIFVICLCLVTYIYEWYVNNVYIDFNILIVSSNVLFGIMYLFKNNMNVRQIMMYISMLICFYMIFTYNECIKSMKTISSYDNSILYGLIVGSALTQFLLPIIVYIINNVEEKSTKKYVQKMILLIYIVTMTILNQIVQVLIDREYNAVMYSFIIVNYMSIVIMLFFIGLNNSVGNFKIGIKITEILCINIIVIISILQTLIIHKNITEKV